MAIIILFFMLFFHILNDIFAQKLIFVTHLFTFKTRPDEIKDKHNPYIALIEVGFLWTFTIMFPITWILLSATVPNYVLFLYITCFIANWGLHYIVDYYKSKLWTTYQLLGTQSVRIIQIITTWVLMILYCKL